MTYQKLYTAQEPKEPNFQHVQLDYDHAVWRYYRRPGDMKDVPVRPSYAILTAMYQAKLFRIVNDSITVYCGLRGQIDAYKILDLYRRFENWKDELPEKLYTDNVKDPLPHILYLQ